MSSRDISRKRLGSWPGFSPEAAAKLDEISMAMEGRCMERSTERTAGFTDSRFAITFKYLLRTDLTANERYCLQSSSKFALNVDVCLSLDEIQYYVLMTLLASSN
ncbi:hypothetical protein FGSG_12238 [Fusarium graminearum PH-1]|uniref:hypothetical protein n=1 Tax=Gibberella zeae (strain ATCC MYA-4620 / CBS 123657 / FGSC 9075 / NRRL 31084 / PH-1) TaxID=229533 RepID=UPI00021F1B77|nr:hypothetical protein FGSG_12238 [Fusarium graminearum PH-1]ESU08581.1 hypothetical protein FGSG_12238 [Fusarium graminearum PH-1]KAI6773239.1 hypothetical protein HG531_000088 [Fusarium graminearum]|eukprot:XP_011321080.1 hypothetical protein FGSG_12238 [Fusarium graminearum PH-1]